MGGFMNSKIDKKKTSGYETPIQIGKQLFEAGLNSIKAFQLYGNGVLKYLNDFMAPFGTALNAFNRLEKIKILKTPPWDTLRDYFDLFLFNMQVAEKGAKSSFSVMNDYHARKSSEAFSAWLNTICNHEGETLDGFTDRQVRLLHKLVYEYPQEILAIRPYYGFHFETDGYIKTAETDRFILYQVLPTEKSVSVRPNGKPIIILPPYVLGPNILAFLPGEKKSYVHSFANMGIPTYIRVIKDIQTTPAVQTMTGEDDARDLRYFCEQVILKHEKPVTVNGFCQGGFIAVLDVLSGELDGVVDALITCVAPMDGTRSIALVEYLKHLPPRFRDLGYALKTLPNGNRIVDGAVMSWVYKLKSMDREAPLVTFYRDLSMFDRPDGKDIKISSTAAAINYWLIYDRTDLPEAITKLSFDSYTIPVDKDGNLPVKLFNTRLNFKRIQEKNIRFLICYAEMDDLVDKPAALAPLDFINAEVSVFPKGHAGIATSWSHPGSECALHTRFGKNNYRGPVRFQLDLEIEQEQGVQHG